MHSNVGFRSARSAWLVANAAMALVVLPAVVWLVLSGVRAANGDLRVAMETMTRLESSVALPAGWEVAGELPVRVTMANPPLLQFLLFVGSNAAGFFLALGILWLIRSIAASVRRGNPFHPANVRRLRWIGILLLVGYPLSVIIGGFFTNWFFSNEHSPVLPYGLVIGFPIVSLGAVLGGLCTLLLAEVFRYGIDLREDVEATV
jgi:DUF2975 family protein